MKKFWDSQFGNLFYWVPICLAFGAATYFIMPNEFCPPYACALAVVALVLACLSKMPIILRGIFFIVFGFLYAATFTDFIATPQIRRDLRDVEITGQITNTNFTDTRTRIFVRVNGSDIGTDAQYANLRLTVMDENAPQIGDTVRMRASILRHHHPMRPIHLILRGGYILIKLLQLGTHQIFMFCRTENQTVWRHYDIHYINIQIRSYQIVLFWDIKILSQYQINKSGLRLASGMYGQSVVFILHWFQVGCL